jgi:hypothetical protein
MKHLTFSLSLMLLASTPILANDDLPRPPRESLQQMKNKVREQKGRLDQMMSRSAVRAMENDQLARQRLLEFSEKLERLEDALQEADNNWNSKTEYPQSIRKSCRVTRKLRNINRHAKNAAGDPVIGSILPSNPIFTQNSEVVQDVRNTIYCDTYEQKFNDRD